VQVMSVAGRIALITALTSFYWAYFNAWRHIFWPLWVRGHSSASHLSTHESLPRTSDSPFHSPEEPSSELEPASFVLSVPSFVLLLALHFPLAMFGWSYYLTSTVGPGYVPKDWVTPPFVLFVFI
jgi:hypothetical protein